MLLPSVTRAPLRSHLDHAQEVSLQLQLSRTLVGLPKRAASRGGRFGHAQPWMPQESACQRLAKQRRRQVSCMSGKAHTKTRPKALVMPNRSRNDCPRLSRRTQRRCGGLGRLSRPRPGDGQQLSRAGPTATSDMKFVLKSGVACSPGRRRPNPGATACRERPMSIWP